MMTQNADALQHCRHHIVGDAAGGADQHCLQSVGDADHGDQTESGYQQRVHHWIAGEDRGDGVATEPDDDADRRKQPDIEASTDPAGDPQADLVVATDGIGHAHRDRRLQPERQHEHEGVDIDGVLIGGKGIIAEPASEHRGGREGDEFDPMASASGVPTRSSVRMLW